MLVYDAENRLQTYAPASTATRQFFYDGVDLFAEYDASGNLLRRYVHGPGDDEPLVWYEGSGTSTRRFFVADERGSIAAVTDSAGVNLVMNTYNEYGVPTATGSVPSRFGYTGQVWLPEISMAYYKARMYAPTLGRFLQTDPIGYADGMNWYAYVHNDPMNRTDSSGLKVTDFGNGCTKVKYPVGVEFHQPNSAGNGIIDGYWAISYSCSGSSFENSNQTDHQPTSQGGSQGGGGGGGTSSAPVPAPAPAPPCPTGPVLQLSFGPSATAFAGFWGISISIQVGVSIPISSLLHRNLAGMQTYVSSEIDPMVGIGEFLGGGPVVGGGYSNTPMESGGSINPIGVHQEAGGAIIGGASVGTTYNNSAGSAGGWPRLNTHGIRPKLGEGAYMGVGPAISGQMVSQQLFCK